VNNPVSKMFEENDVVRLRVAIPTLGLLRGVVGTVVHVFSTPVGFLIEFTDAEGQTLGTEVLQPEHLDLVWSAQHGFPTAHAAA
jgi:hypothetical protein